MKKKQMLATLVMLSLLQGSVYAENYNDEPNVSSENIQFDQMIVDSWSPETIHIGNDETKTITIGDKGLSRDYAVEINESFGWGGTTQKPHDVYFNADSIEIIGGKGLSVGGDAKNSFASLNIAGNNSNFTINAAYDADSAYNNCGLNVSDYGKFEAGSVGDRLNDFIINGGAGLSVGISSSGTAKSKIYANNVSIDASNSNYGAAFTNHGTSTIDALYKITFKGSSDFHSKNGVITVKGNSDTLIHAENIDVVVNPEAGTNEYFYAIYADNGDGLTSDEPYVSKINADKLLNIEGNVLLNGKGEMTLKGNKIQITGKNFGVEEILDDKGRPTNSNWKNDATKSGGGIVVRGAGILKIGDYDNQNENKTNNLIITSKGYFGVLVGNKTGTDENTRGQLYGKVNQHIGVEAKNGVGFAVLRGHSKADITTGSMSITGKTDGVQVDSGSMIVTGSDVLYFEGKDGIGLKGIGASPFSDGYIPVIDYETTVTASEVPAIWVKSYDDAINTVSGFNTTLKANGGKIVLKSSNASGINVTSSHYEDDTLVNNTNLSSDTGIDVIGATFAIEAYDRSDVNLNTENSDITLVSNDLNATKDSKTSTVYVEGDGTLLPTVDLTAENGVVNIWSNNKSVVASGKGGTVNINGAVNINTHYTGDNSGISLMEDDEQHVAIAAGGDRELLDSCGYGEVNVNLTGKENSQIIGDIVGARDGVVNVNSADYSGSLTVFGDILAGNGGTRQDGEGKDVTVGAVNIDLGKGGYFEGRVDDYQDANLKDALEFFDPHFTDGKVTQAGTVNLKMGSGSKWQVTGQSWVTTLDGNDSTIILNGEESGGYAVHIGKLTGNNTFVVNLNPDKSEFAEGDMIYVQDGTYSGLQTLKVANEEELLKNKDWDRIRFATVANAAGSAGDSNFEYGGSFGDTYTIKGRGIRNVDYAIEYVAMDEDTTSDEDNLAYNGGSEDLTAEKPGTKYNKETYNKTDEGQNSQYVYLARSNGTDDGTGDYTDSAKSIINMSRANYKNAIYMDRLNKRLGEARYINGEEEQGMWVRIRHDRIGMDGEFRSQNTMYEMGYDEKQDCDNGERRVGFAIDYMDGSTTYSDIMGKGETKRYGLWLYDTWLGDKGHYADYVAKWGHLSNDFDIHDKDSLDHVVGDYSNNVFSVSAEYGRKKDIGNDWYIEPQAQLQLARVTGAEYTTTTQDTKVSVDGINSLIGRAGFRLGRDVDERSTVYIKADLLHEFLGDQTITATDATGSLRETFENKGTWYDIGFGFATALGKDSYAFMDFEKSFGNGNDETYQINAGVQWTF